VRTPFPGMDPWLEHPALWPGVHNRLITAIADDLTARVAPRYFVGVEQHTYVTSTLGDLASIRPDVLVGRSRSRKRIPTPGEPATAGAGVLAKGVEVPVEVQVEDWYLDIRLVGTGKLVTVIEVLSPWNKAPGQGRKKYLRKRKHIFKTRTSLVEVDLLRGGKPMPVNSTDTEASDYRVLVSPGRTRPRAELYAFGVRQPIPAIPIPLLPRDPAPLLDLNAVLHSLYERARFDLVLDYARPPVPPLEGEDVAWAQAMISDR
jgi:Protein of unknown function (DUF4058)